eukprot:jgi/Bigna1/92025/estExt_fgenesh1_pg.C_1860002
MFVISGKNERRQSRFTWKGFRTRLVELEKSLMKSKSDDICLDVFQVGRRLFPTEGFFGFELFEIFCTHFVSKTEHDTFGDLSHCSQLKCALNQKNLNTCIRHFVSMGLLALSVEHERLQSKWKHLLMSLRFRVLAGLRFSNLPEFSRILWKILEASGMLSKILEDSRIFRNVLEASGRFSKLLEDSRSSENFHAHNFCTVLHMDAIPKGFGVRMVGKILPTKHRTTRRLKLCAEAQNSQACNWARCHGHGALRNRQEKFLPDWARCHHF